MPIFYAIAAMSENRVIGNQGKIPWHIPDDFRWFKHKTMGGTLIMGRKTFESIGKPLPGRKTVVLSQGKVTFPGTETCPDWRQLPSTDAPLPNFWVCGGAEIYREMLPSCAYLYLTRIKRDVQGDTLFPIFEDAFFLDQIIHENDQFRVERWKHKNIFDSSVPAVEQWPFPKATS